MNAAFADLARAEGLKDQPRRGGHQRQERRGEGHKDVHRAGDGEGHGLGALESNGFGDDLTEDHVHVSDQKEGDHDADGVRVNVGIGQAGEERLQHVGHGGFADPAQRQAGEGDAELYGRDEVVQLLV